jgi:hypothetical protein
MEMKTMTRTFSITSAALVAAFFLTPGCFAADSKVYSGAICKPASPATYYPYVSYPLGPHYGILNFNGYTIAIVCPIIQDSVANTSGTSAGKVYWTAANPSDYIVCALKSLNFDGSVRQQVFADRFGTGWMTLPNITTDDMFGAYVVDCQLPTGGMLNTIWIEEVE